ncbi:MAG: MBL fold metallo-hydrolase [bacterium]
MRFCVLASGSNGNCCFVEEGDTRLLIDVGIGPRVLGWRLGPLDVRPSQLTDLLVTHEHADHIRGIEGLLKRQPALRIHATRGTARALPEAARPLTHSLSAGRELDLGPLRILPMSTSHDSAQPVCFRVESAAGVLGYATDLGTFGARIVELFTGADALVVESNHCPELLVGGPYPDYLKARVAGPQGHLSNDQCRSLLERLWHPGLRHVTLAHLSEVNNNPETALRAMQPFAEAHPEVRWAVGSRSEALPPVQLGAPSSSPGQLPLPI